MHDTGTFAWWRVAGHRAYEMERYFSFSTPTFRRQLVSLWCLPEKPNDCDKTEQRDAHVGGVWRYTRKHWWGRVGFKEKPRVTILQVENVFRNIWTEKYHRESDFLTVDTFFPVIVETFVSERNLWIMLKLNIFTPVDLAWLLLCAGWRECWLVSRLTC